MLDEVRAFIQPQLAQMPKSRMRIEQTLETMERNILMRQFNEENLSRWLDTKL